MNLNPKELKRIHNIDIEHPSYPHFRNMVMDLADSINQIVAELLNRENKYENNYITKRDEAFLSFILLPLSSPLTNYI